jgi:hypothetical protein
MTLLTSPPDGALHVVSIEFDGPDRALRPRSRLCLGESFAFA